MENLSVNDLSVIGVDAGTSWLITGIDMPVVTVGIPSLRKKRSKSPKFS
jgi:hypothetical protein